MNTLNIPQTETSKAIALAMTNHPSKPEVGQWQFTLRELCLAILTAWLAVGSNLWTWEAHRTRETHRMRETHHVKSFRQGFPIAHTVVVNSSSPAGASKVDVFFNSLGILGNLAVAILVITVLCRAMDQRKVVDGSTVTLASVCLLLLVVCYLTEFFCVA